MENDLTKSIWKRIEQSWSETDAEPEYLQFLRIALSSDTTKTSAHENYSSKWALVPGLSCQAAGGDPQWAQEITAAWLLFYAAADIMDSVEDQDEPQAWWAQIGPAAALNAASGMYFCASRLLNGLHGRDEINSCATEIIEDFYRGFLRMCGGQHREIVTAEPTLEGYWKTVETKSGAFFALASRAGARLATDDPQRLAAFSNFGKHLGILVQILDDLDDIKKIPQPITPRQAAGLYHSLPIVYSLEVASPPDRRRLKESLASAGRDPQAARRAVGLIEKFGSVLYILTMVESHKQLALEFLDQTNPTPAAADQLIKMIKPMGSLGDRTP